jgi:hypothetical protein
MLIWKGPTRDTKSLTRAGRRATIQAIMTGHRALGSRISKNPKTGSLLTLWIVLKHLDPIRAAKTGRDSAICGDCKRRPKLASTTKTRDKKCYVVLKNAPLSTWRAHRNRPIGDLRTVQGVLEHYGVRFGGLGDPALLPIGLIRLLVRMAGGARRKHTMYTHLWQTTAGKRLRAYAMASVDSVSEANQARADGWRYFRVKGRHDPVLPGETVCPASVESGHRSTCDRCLLCDGTRDVPGGDKRSNIVINAH